ncbi:MAG: protease modulator HflC [Clostridia bacterium]|nr:protease modulator HflC [Clostridia bacterium]
MKKFSILKWLVALVLIVVLAFFGFTAEVREGECAVITRFGAPRAEITESGLYLRLPWPFEDIVKYDARRQYLESNYLETLTRDKRNIILNSYVVWEISDPLTYYNSVRSADIAEQYIRDLVTNATNGVLGGYDLTALVSLDEEKIKIDQIQEEIFTRVSETSQATYGIAIDEVSILRMSLPDVNLQSVFDQMKADRQKEIDQIVAEAERDANKIITDADARAAEIKAKGTTDAAELKAKTETEVARIYAEAQAANLELYQFLRQLDTVAGSVGSGTTMIVRTDEYPFNVLAQYGGLLDGSDGSAEADGAALAAALAELPEAERADVTAALWALIAEAGRDAK